jgi:hypothetical protein
MPDTNQYEALMRTMKVVKDRVRGVVHRQTNGVYLYGRAGTSKSFTVRSTLDTLAVQYAWTSGHLTPIGLFDLFRENHERVIVCDDVSAIFKEPIALQLMLAGLGSRQNGSNKRLIRYKRNNSDEVVEFAGGLICISNLPLDGHDNAVLAALNDRVFVLNFDPPDEQIIALIMKLAEDGIRGVAPAECQMVAAFLLAECAARNIRPSVRLFVDKAISDYILFAAGQSETHWKDLILSNLEQQVIELQHPTKDLTRAERIQAERQIARQILLSCKSRSERIEAWEARTQKSESAFYRRRDELIKAGEYSKELHENSDGGK